MGEDLNTDDAWLELRRLRAQPPGPVADTDYLLFRAALEQAESYHRAASTSGPSTSPVLLYYQMVQVAKAVQLAGGVPRESLSRFHGLKEPDHPVPLFEREVVAEGGAQTHFKAIQRALGEEPVNLRTTIGALVAGNPDAHSLFPSLTNGRPVTITRDYAPLPFETPAPPVRLRLQVEYAGPYRSVEETNALLGGIPCREGWTAHTQAEDDNPIMLALMTNMRERHYRRVSWPVQQDAYLVMGQPTMQEVHGWAASGTNFSYNGPVQVSPLAPTGAKWSRLTWWWPLLHALGHIARYEPDTWATAIDLDHGSSGADLHALLDRAWKTLPAISVWAIKQAQATHGQQQIALELEAIRQD